MPDTLIYDDVKVIYIALNKTASTSTIHTLGYNYNDRQKKSGVLGLPVLTNTYDTKGNNSFYRKNYPNYFIFTFVRNPYDRIVSYFMWGKYNNSSNNSIWNDFDTFVKNIVSNTDYNVSDFCLQTFTIDNISYMDFIGKFENYQDDMKILMKMLNLDFYGVKEHKNKMERERDYRKYYKSTESIEIVTTKFKRDLDVFDYKF